MTLTEPATRQRNRCRRQHDGEAACEQQKALCAIQSIAYSGLSALDGVQTLPLTQQRRQPFFISRNGLRRAADQESILHATTWLNDTRIGNILGVHQKTRTKTEDGGCRVRLAPDCPRNSQSRFSHQQAIAQRHIE